MNDMFRKIGDLCLHNITLINPKNWDNKDFLYIDISAIDNSGKRIVYPKRVKGKDASVRARQLVQENDVIVSTTRPNLNAVATITKEYDNQVCSTGFCVLRCGSELHPEYLFHFVQSPTFVKSLTELVQGALYPAVTDKQVFAQQIPWVSLETQRLIAARLTTQLVEVEKARKAVEAQLKEISNLPSRILSQAFDLKP